VQSTSLGTVTYDAAGDVTVDNSNYYLYDAEGRISGVPANRSSFAGW